jgi:ribonuclease VapC
MNLSPSVNSGQCVSSVLDASALLVHLKSETGKEKVAEAFLEGAVMSLVNWAEVLSTLAKEGKSPGDVVQQLKAEGLLYQLLSLEPLTEEDCLEIARLRVVTQKYGLSLGDRAALALAKRLNAVVLTTDKIWAELDVGAKIEVIR